jgi:hypothetical protein
MADSICGHDCLTAYEILPDTLRRDSLRWSQRASLNRMSEVGGMIAIKLQPAKA